VTYEDL